MDDFNLSIFDSAGNYHSWPRQGLKVELEDRLVGTPPVARQVYRRGHAQSHCLPGDPEMKMHRWLAALTLISIPLASTGQGLDPKLLLKPAIDAWPTYNGDYSGRRFSPLTEINAANVGSLCPRLVLSHLQRRRAARRRQPRHQIHSADGQRHPLLHHSRPRLGARRPHRRGDLALRLAGQGRPPGGQSRLRHVRRLALLHDPGLLVGLAQRQGRQRALAQESRRREDAVFLHHQPAGGEESHHRRRGRRCHGCPRLPGRARSRNRRGAVALEHHAPQGRARRRDLAQSASHGARRRHDLDARHLRPRAEPALLGHRQSQPRLRRTGPARAPISGPLRLWR